MWIQIRVCHYTNRYRAKGVGLDLIILFYLTVISTILHCIMYYLAAF